MSPVEPRDTPTPCPDPQAGREGALGPSSRPDGASLPWHEDESSIGNPDEQPEEPCAGQILPYLLERICEIEGSAIRINDGPLIWIHTEQEVREWLVTVLSRP